MNIRIAKKIVKLRRSRNRAQWRKAWALVRRHDNRRNAKIKPKAVIITRWNEEPVPDWLTIEALDRAQVIHKWRYREVWANCEWELSVEPGTYHSTYKGRRYDYEGRNYNHGWEEKICRMANQRSDNHSTALLDVDGHPLFVCFHDFVIMLGTTCRFGSYGTPRDWPEEYNHFLK